MSHTFPVSHTHDEQAEENRYWDETLRHAEYGEWIAQQAEAFSEEGNDEDVD
jgi:hypothetical protein